MPSLLQGPLPLTLSLMLAIRLDERHEPTGGIAERNEQRTNTRDGERMRDAVWGVGGGGGALGLGAKN